MKVITISREYGAGGGEVARKLAERLGWTVLDRELLHQAAEIEHVPDADLERLDEKAISMADRFTLHPPHRKYLHGLTEAVRRAAERGNVILVGRGGSCFLRDDPRAFMSGSGTEKGEGRKKGTSLILTTWRTVNQ
jgi:cytidylate kinase